MLAREDFRAASSVSLGGPGSRRPLEIRLAAGRAILVHLAVEERETSDRNRLRRADEP
jgi:hypothetical protein